MFEESPHYSNHGCLQICGLLAMRHTCQESVDTLQARCTSAAKAAVAASQNHGGSGAGNSDSSSAAGAIALVMEAAGLKGPGMTVSEAVLAVIWLLLMAINMRQVKSELQVWLCHSNHTHPVTSHTPSLFPDAPSALLLNCLPARTHLPMLPTHRHCPSSA